MTPETIALVLAITAAAYMAWNIGANDVANAMGTSVGSGALTLMGAVILAGIFEFAGATLAGTQVSETIRKDILDPTLFQPGGPLGAEGPQLLMVGMLGSLLAAGVWLQIATMMGLPVSTTHSIVGAVIGFGIAAAGMEAVDWGTAGSIAASWVVSPAVGGLLGAGMFLVVRHGILLKPDPIEASRRIGPHLVALVSAVLVLSFIYKALKNVLNDPTWWQVGAAAAVGGLIGYMLTKVFLQPRRVDPARPYDFVERMFGKLQIVTACSVAFAHGANDVANAVGPMAAVYQIATLGELPTAVPVPLWILVLGAGGIVAGLATWGYKVIATIGKKITELTPTRGFSAEFGAAATVLIASQLGMPISTTHTLVGAVIGVGLARGLSALDLRQVGRIVNSWLVTLPAAALFSVGFFHLFRWVLL